MPLESASFISQLVLTNPANTDLKSDGAAQMRVIKTAVQGSFPSLGAVAVNTTAAELNHVVGVTSAIQTQINSINTLKANLASPTLTGVPLAPTAAALTNNTQVATTAYADAATAAEAALRIFNDALKANLASPTFTGTVTVPSPTNGTDAANKTYVDGVAFATTLPSQTGNAGKFVTTNGTTASWASLPPATGATIYLALNAGAL